MPRKQGQTKKIQGEKLLGFVGDDIVIETNLGLRLCSEVDRGETFVYRGKKYEVLGEVPEGAQIKKQKSLDVFIGSHVRFTWDCNGIETPCWGKIEATFPISEKREGFVILPYGERSFGHVVMARSDFYPIKKCIVDRWSWEWVKWREWNSKYLRSEECQKMYELIRERGIDILCPL